MAGRDSLEKMIAKILHRHCEFGWAHYYIPSEKFPNLVDELLRLFLGLKRYASEQERVDQLLTVYRVLKREESC